MGRNAVIWRYALFSRNTTAP